MIALRATAGLLALLVGSGCLPMNVTKSPGASGVVVDADTGSPLAGAEVLVSTTKYQLGTTAGDAGAPSSRVPPSVAAALAAARKPVVSSAADGRFTVPPDRKWILVIAGMERVPPTGTLVVRHPGYTSALCDLPQRSQDVGEVRLTPLR